MRVLQTYWVTIENLPGQILLNLQEECTYVLCVTVPWHACVDQRTAWENPFSSSTMWVMGFELGLSGLSSDCLSISLASESFLHLNVGARLGCPCLSLQHCGGQRIGSSSPFTAATSLRQENLPEIPSRKFKITKQKALVVINNYMKYIDCWYFKVMMNVGFFLSDSSCPHLFGNNIDKASSSWLPLPQPFALALVWALGVFIISGLEAPIWHVFLKHELFSFISWSVCC